MNRDGECTKSTKGSNADRIQELTEDDLHQMKHRLETKTDELIQQHVRADAQQVCLEKVSEELVEVKVGTRPLEHVLNCITCSAGCQLDQCLLPNVDLWHSVMQLILLIACVYVCATSSILS